MRFEPVFDLPDAIADDALLFVFAGDALAVTSAGDVPTFAMLAHAVSDLVPVGTLGERLVVAGRLHDVTAAHELVGLRPLWGRLDEAVWTLAGRALQLVAWDRDHAFCGRCGSATTRLAGERARGCPACRLPAYPRLAPAIIVLVERDDGKALLCHGVRFPTRSFSCLAGFVDPGESLVEAVHRELYEEAGISVRDVAYRSSQPWPFPHSLMVGFTAHHAAGELRLDPSEIVDGGWYGIDELPELPPYPSIARRLIDDWITRSS